MLRALQWPSHPISVPSNSIHRETKRSQCAQSTCKVRLTAQQATKTKGNFSIAMTRFTALPLRCGHLATFPPSLSHHRLPCPSSCTFHTHTPVSGAHQERPNNRPAAGNLPCLKMKLKRGQTTPSSLCLPVKRKKSISTVPPPHMSHNIRY